MKRTQNQDDFLILEFFRSQLFIIFDGVSSLSQSHTLIRKYKSLLKSEFKSETIDLSKIEGKLFMAHSKLDLENLNGYSTMSSLLLIHQEKRAFVQNIGDSRVYSLTNRYLNKLTQDDSISPGSSTITNYLGKGDLSIVDFAFHEVTYESNFLLCTDGFYKNMELDLKEYFKALNYSRTKNVASKLKALEQGRNDDDSTYILVRNEV